MSDETILTERIRGRTLRDLADTTGLTPEGVRFVVARESRRQLDRIELALLRAASRTYCETLTPWASAARAIAV